MDCIIQLYLQGLGANDRCLLGGPRSAKWPRRQPYSGARTLVLLPLNPLDTNFTTDAARCIQSGLHFARSLSIGWEINSIVPLDVHRPPELLQTSRSALDDLDRRYNLVYDLLRLTCFTKCFALKQNVLQRLCQPHDYLFAEPKVNSQKLLSKHKLENISSTAHGDCDTPCLCLP